MPIMVMIKTTMAMGIQTINTKSHPKLFRKEAVTALLAWWAFFLKMRVKTIPVTIKANKKRLSVTKDFTVKILLRRMNFQAVLSTHWKLKSCEHPNQSPLPSQKRKTLTQIHQPFAFLSKQALTILGILVFYS